MLIREILHIDQPRAASDGDGVKLKRVFGGSHFARYDPFLLMDDFGSDQADDYIGGFPAHPHRGFETITYMLHGKMQHQDHLGNVGCLEDGDVQWMCAAHGIIHSEMPQQTQGRMRGFQLWLNLPADEKMKAPDYRDIAAKDIPQFSHQGNHYKLIAGNITLAGQAHQGAVSGLTTQALYLDITLAGNTPLSLDIPDGHNVLIYGWQHPLEIAGQTLQPGQLAVLSRQGQLQLNGPANSRLLLLAGKPLNQPVVQHGPFVMNNRQQILQAIEDYQHNRLTNMTEMAAST